MTPPESMQTSELLKELRIDRNGRPARARGRWLALAAAVVLALAGGLWLAWGRVRPPTVRTVTAVHSMSTQWAALRTWLV